MNNSIFVKHPTISAEQFDGKRLVLFQGGKPCYYQLQVQKHTDDGVPIQNGAYILNRLSTVVKVSFGWSQPQAFPNPAPVPIAMDQNTVSQISRVESSSEFADKSDFQLNLNGEAQSNQRQENERTRKVTK
jgi:hypothetical protein